MLGWGEARNSELNLGFPIGVGTQGLESAAAALQGVLTRNQNHQGNLDSNPGTPMWGYSHSRLAEDGQVWAPAAHVRGLDEAPAFHLAQSQSLGMNQQMEYCSHSDSEFQISIEIFHHFTICQSPGFFLSEQSCFF